MRLWLNRTGEVSLREQLITQVTLAILCKEMLPGQRLPSTRDLARRFNIHANTGRRIERSERVSSVVAAVYDRRSV